MSKEFIEFVEEGQSESGKTKIFEVRTIAAGTHLGQIRWYAPWRKYVFYAATETLYDPACLRAIALNLDCMTIAHTDELRKAV